MPFSEITAIGPPRPDQIEICVFGPNYGECIVIHIGNGRWVVVDSCIYAATKEPVALAYFRALGIDPARAIKTIIATHWHDDHCRGLSQVLLAAPAAQVWIASALTNVEFLRFVARMKKNRTAVAGNKLSEFSKIIDDIKSRRAAGFGTFGYGSARMLIFRLDQAQSGHGFSCEGFALSPSHGDVFNFLTRIAANMPRSRATKRVVPSPQPNDVSMVTVIYAGPVSILLGADLENSGTSTAGWEAIIESHRIMPLGSKSGFYKVPHHGSSNSLNPEVWQSMLSADPFAVLTPWRKGGGRLPTESGVGRILTLTNSAFATATDARTRRQSGVRPPGVLRFLRENRAIRLRSLEAPFGAVRVRTADAKSGQWHHELFGAACHLRKFRATKEER